MSSAPSKTHIKSSSHQLLFVNLNQASASGSSFVLGHCYTSWIGFNYGHGFSLWIIHCWSLHTLSISQHNHEVQERLYFQENTPYSILDNSFFFSPGTASATHSHRLLDMGTGDIITLLLCCCCCCPSSSTSTELLIKMLNLHSWVWVSLGCLSSVSQYME